VDKSAETQVLRSLDKSFKNLYTDLILYFNFSPPPPLVETLRTSARAGGLPKKGGSGFAEHGKIE